MDPENVSKYLAGISPHRLDSVKPPRQSWKNRSRCFRLFDAGLRPRDISPRQCGVSRKSLYRYFQDWKLLEAKREAIILKVKQELALQRQASRGIATSKILIKGE